MLFYRTRATNMPSTRRGVSRPFTTADPGETTHLTWMLRSFAMGVTLLGLSYCLVHLAGFQYVASLTSVTLLAFLLAYVVWCVVHRNKIARQRSDGSSRTETAAHISPAVGNPVPITPEPPPPFDYQRTFKSVTRTPGRDQSPPPTYEEAIRAMMFTVTCTPELTCQPPVSPNTESRPSQQRQAAILTSPGPTVSVPRLNSSTSILSPSVLVSSPPPSALTCPLSSPSALMPVPSPVVQTHSALTLQESGLTPLSQSGETPQPSASLTQTSPTALTPASTVLFTTSEHPTPHIEVS